MDNQHQKITGYRDLSQAEIDLINEAKALAQKCGDLCEKLDSKIAEELKANQVLGHPDDETFEALRWFEDGKKGLQKGFMAVIRSIARPTTF